MNASLDSLARWPAGVRRRLGRAGAWLLAAVLGSLASGTTALASPPAVERFDATAWQVLQKDLPRPSAIVFTATYCATCPAVLAQLAAALQLQGIKGEIVAVVIDAAQAQQLLGSRHYQHASRLFLFAGNEASLRYQVDPRWRGVTPYVALLNSHGEMLFTAGTPSEAQVAAWLAR